MSTVAYLLAPVFQTHFQNFVTNSTWYACHEDQSATSSLSAFLIEFWLKATLSYRMSARCPFAGLVTIAFFNYVFLSLVFNEILYGRN